MTQLVTAEGPILDAGERQTLPASARSERTRSCIGEAICFNRLADIADCRKSFTTKITKQTKHARHEEHEKDEEHDG